MVPFDGGYRAWRAAVGEGWRIADAFAREEARFHGRAVVPGAAVRRGRRRAAGRSRGRAGQAAAAPAPAPSAGSRPPQRAPKLSKDAYRRQKAVIDDDLTRLGPAQEPPRARRSRPVDRRQLRRAAAGHERARRRRPGARRGRGGLAAPRGAGAVSRAAPAAAPDRIARAGGPTRMPRRRPHRAHRPDRLRQVDRRRAGSPSAAPSSIDADDDARAVTAPGEPAHAAVLARFGDAVRAADGTLDRAALARLVFADPAALARPRGDRPPGGPAADPRRDRGRRRRRRAGRRDRGDQARRGRPRRALRRGLAGDLRAGRPAGAPCRARDGAGRRRTADRRPGRPGRSGSDPTRRGC